MLWLTVFSLPFVNFPPVRMPGFPVQITEGLFLLTGITWVIFLALRKSRIRFSSFYLPIGFCLFALCLSAAFSENLRVSGIKLAGSVYLLGLAVLSFNIVDSAAKFRQITHAWLAATFLVCLISLASFILFYFDRTNPILLLTLSHYGSLPAGNYPRIQSMFFNPNMMVNYLNISLGLLCLAFQKRWLSKSVLVILGALFALTVVFSVSPGIGGILLSAGLWIFVEYGKVKPLFARLALTTGIAAALFFFISTIPSPTTFPRSLEPSPRVLTWASAIETFSANPVNGRGIGLDAGNVQVVVPEGSQTLGDAHQLWLSIAAQQGIVGLFAVFFLMFWFFRRILPLHSSGSSVRLALSVGFIGAFCYQGLTGSFEDARHIWVMLGLLAAAFETELSR